MLTNMFSLDQWLTDWLTNLPPSFAYSQSKLRHKAMKRTHSTYGLLFALFHQCRLVLYGSLVPQICGLPLPARVPIDVVRLSAQKTVESAQALSQLASDLLELNQNPAEFAPFLGYCMYASACVHLAFFSSRDPRLAGRVWSDFNASVNLLEAVKPFWKMPDRLVSPERIDSDIGSNSPQWQRISVLRQAHADFEKSFIEVEDTKSDDERLTDIRNDTGNLKEPLALSLLQYKGQESGHSLPATDSVMVGDGDAAAGSTDPVFFQTPDSMLPLSSEWWDQSFQVFPEGLMPSEDLFSAIM